MSLPSKKRKLSDEDTSSLPSIDVTSPKPTLSPVADSSSSVAAATADAAAAAPRKDSAGSDDTAAMALKALSALDVAQHGAAKHFPLKKRKTSTADSSWEDDQALGLTPVVDGAGVSSTAEKSTHEKEATPPKSNIDITSNNKALDHLDALGDETTSSLGSKPTRKRTRGMDLTIGDEESGDSGTHASSGNQRILLEALMSGSSAGGSSSAAAAVRRDRLESWGGMSDLSATGGFGDGRLGDAAAALAASALHYTGLIDDVTAAAAYSTASLGSHSSGGGEQQHKMSAVPSRISLTDGGGCSNEGVAGRKGSGASELSMIAEGGESVAPSIQAVVDAAMASVGDQLADLAGAVEMAAAGADLASLSSDCLRREVAAMDSDDLSSTQSPLIGVSDLNATTQTRRPRSASASSKPLSVDYNAVAAAVDAAQAATGALDLATIGDMAPPPVPSVVLSKPNTEKADPRKKDIPKTTISEKDIEARRARARKAAGYVPPSSTGTPAPRPPLKKRPKQPSPISKPPAVPGVVGDTPRVSNVSIALDYNGSVYEASACPPMPEHVSSSEPGPAEISRSNQKWEEMFQCLIQFREDRREEDLKGASAEERESWVWDGNVPTTYKTSNGKALGRWVNNQRSSKTKGTLKPEREDRLISTGLRWCGATINTAWQEMLRELHLYVKEKTKDGKEWDGNVPTNYSVKTNGEEKNLGRWVNRQRSAKQAGKLRQEREQQLNEIGLKWSVLTSTSWDDMFLTLCEYVKERKAQDPNNRWDGNVPVNYKTEGDDSKALGRWVNRQRSNYGKRKLKKEQIDKLEQLGLKWAVHDRKPAAQSNVVVSRLKATNGTTSSTKNGKGTVSASSSEGLQQQDVPVSSSSQENSNNEEKIKITAV